MGVEPVEKLGAIRVSWEAPEPTVGELAITGYRIRYKIRGNNPFMYKNGKTDTMTEVSGLEAGIEYRVYVAFVNELGPGKYCCTGNAKRLFVTTHRGMSKLHV